MKKIVLIDSISCTTTNIYPQIGPLIIKNILSEKYDVELISFTTMAYKKEIKLEGTIKENIEKFTNIILERKPSIVSFYTMCDSFYFSIRIAERLKRLNKNIKIVMAGPHATLMAKDILEKFDFVDVISLGEGEKTVLILWILYWKVLLMIV